VRDPQSMTPTVSVVVTTFNQAAYIAPTIESVLRQTLQPIEVIVVDDGSTDETAAQIAGFGDRVKYLRQANQGVAAARNAGVRAATGELVALLDGDDLWNERKLEYQVHAFVAHPESGLIAGDVSHFSDDTVLWTDFLKCNVLNGSDMPVHTGHYFKALVNRNIICTTSQVMIPAKVLREIGPSDTRFPLASDYDLYLRIAAKYPITFVNQVLTHWRFLESSASGSKSRRGFRWSADTIGVLRKHSRGLPTQLRAEARAAWRGHLSAAAHRAYYHGCNTDRVWATGYLLQLAWANPAASWVGLFAAALWVPAPLRQFMGSSIREVADVP
jgi:glycosyltransferase involved in cell wall biosynthesis